MGRLFWFSLSQQNYKDKLIWFAAQIAEFLEIVLYTRLMWLAHQARRRDW